MSGADAPPDPRTAEGVDWTMQELAHLAMRLNLPVLNHFVMAWKKGELTADEAVMGALVALARRASEVEAQLIEIINGGNGDAAF